MFYLNRGNYGGGGATKIDKSSANEKEEEKFGWWVGAGESANFANSTILSDNRDYISSESSTSMLSCIDFDDSDSYALALDCPKSSSRSGDDSNCENIELATFNRRNCENEESTSEEELTADVDAATSKESQIFNEGKSNTRQSREMCYTPERLIRSEDYRILTSSPRFFDIPRAGMQRRQENSRVAPRSPEGPRNFRAESKKIGRELILAPLLENKSPETGIPSFESKIEDEEEEEEDSPKYRIESHNPTILGRSDSNSSERSSYEGLSMNSEDLKKESTRRSSLEDTSGIHSNEWSSGTPSDTQINFLCLYDELAVASNRCASDINQEGGGTAINEVESILRVLESDPEKAQILLDEDRFCESASSHDHPTRLALAIETDGTVPAAVFGEPENLLLHLQRRVDRLRHDNKDIFKDIYALRKDFEYEEEKLHKLTSNASKLRDEIHEVHYMDDLLNLLQGELERISDRNWPFVIGHGEHHGELNLVV